LRFEFGLVSPAQLSWRRETPMRRRSLFALFISAGLLSGAFAQTINDSFTGNVLWIEVWKTGNVAFKLDVSNPPCNGQFVLNNLDPGLKNQYAALIAAKLSDRPIRVYVSSCIAAEGYGGSYASVDYLNVD
jgi:hypothetical protein